MDDKDFERIFYLFCGIFFIILLILFIGLFLFRIGGTEGEHSGYVTAVEYNNNLFFDDILVYFKTDLESTQEDRYCVNDENLKEVLKSSAIDRKPVTIHYSNPFFWRRGDCYEGVSIIRSVE